MDKTKLLCWVVIALTTSFISITVRAQNHLSVNNLGDGSEYKCSFSHFWKMGQQTYREIPEVINKTNILTFDKRMQLIISENVDDVGIQTYSYARFYEIKKDHWMHLSKGDLGITYVTNNINNSPVFETLNIFENGKVVKTLHPDSNNENAYFFLGECSGLKLDIRRESND